jgi:hypothetical protein
MSDRFIYNKYFEGGLFGGVNKSAGNFASSNFLKFPVPVNSSNSLIKHSPYAPGATFGLKPMPPVSKVSKISLKTWVVLDLLFREVPQLNMTFGAKDDCPVYVPR